ncbi:MAG: uroporphyrinogen-III C-methyltransferase [Spiribacter sp.]|jgi:uroporphyrin-3 C-methyltransferase|nr:uroporphyrinogen-III C-methyltransferase [Spiribacter sp.]MDR9489379.1 uroporphyrinogen-III C-methyltransferase [Spiribacter sp.]
MTEEQKKTPAEPTEPEASSATDEALKPAPRRSVAGIIALLSVLVLAAAMAAGGWWGYQQLQQLHSAQSALAKQASLEALEQRQQMRLGELGGRVSNLNERLESRLQTLAQVENRMQDEVAARRTLTDRVDQLFRRMQSETADWREAEAAYLARIAAHRVQFNRDIGGALEALEAADLLLAGLGGRAVDRREALTIAINRLLDAERVDWLGVNRGLDAIAGALDDLPLAEGIAPTVTEPESTTTASAESASDRGWQARLERAWEQIKLGLGGLVTVSRNRQVEPLPDPESRFLLQQNLLLQIETARLAALQGETAIYQQALSRIDEWVSAYFDSAAKSVNDVRAELSALQGMTVVADRPAIATVLKPVIEGGESP